MVSGSQGRVHEADEPRAVKFAFLALYYRLMTGLRRYMQLWWAVLVFCAVV